MAHTLTTRLWPSTAKARPLPSEDDPLDAIRGIIFGVLLAIVGFWLPLAFVLTR
jgi:hypothetical protein